LVISQILQSGFDDGLVGPDSPSNPLLPLSTWPEIA
jgi:hypothetical protein